MVNVDALLASEEQFMLAESRAVQDMCARAFPPEEQASGRTCEAALAAHALLRLTRLSSIASLLCATTVGGAPPHFA